jgi:hypothetical protein
LVDFAFVLILVFVFSPLPELMLTYARQDTHYLLYVYDRLKNELLARGNGMEQHTLSVDTDAIALD